jgi:hypothetical protein
MGQNAYLTIIARSEYRKYPRVTPAALAQFDLNKGWVALDQALRTMPPPLDLGLQGDRVISGDDWDAYDAFVTPALARRISAALTDVSEEELIAALKSVGFASRKREYAEHLAFFDRLRAAYQEATKRDAYLRIFIC